MPSPSRSSSLFLTLLLAGCPDPTPEGGERSAAPSAPVANKAIETPKDLAPRVFAPSRAGCDTVPVFARGAEAGSVCVEDAATEGLTVIDLSDSWTPRVFAPKTESLPEYRAKYLELARSPNADLGLNGIAPTMTVLAKRLADDKRRSCDAGVDMASVAAAVHAFDAAPDAKAAALSLKQAQGREPLTAIQSQLVCAGLLKKASANGTLGNATHAALEAFRRRHMIVGAGLDKDTLAALALGGDELAFRGLLRGLRERVADAAGLIEDGTASEQNALVQGRELDFSRFAPATHEALPDGAPDLIDEATDVAARELGLTDPDAARAFLAARGASGVSALRVAVALPAAPTYYSAAMDLRVEIDRGDVFYDSPGGAAKKGERRWPTFVVYAKDGSREIPLVRWATTIGGWKKERTEDGEVVLKYKESDVGDRAWRQIIAAPAWMPPDSTPETDLLKESEDGTVALKRDLIQPGYRNAYGLVMMIHHEESKSGEQTKWLDHGIRTHGSVDYRSIKNGTSHGCHRLYNQLALRMSGFLVQHRNTVTKGKMRAGYSRTLEYNEQTIQVDVEDRGYLYELDPPVPVKVLRGTIASDAEKPVSSIKIETDQTKG